MEYWEDPIFKLIRGTLVTYFSTAMETPNNTLTLVALICVEMDIAMGLPDLVLIDVGDYSFMHTLDYMNCFSDVHSVTLMDT